MKIDAGVGNLTGVGAKAKALEAEGYDGLWTAEIAHDPFLPLVLAAEHTERVTLGTGIAVAFARNPMTLANLGYDLQLHSRGRFVLGLGSQVRAHIENRFSSAWSHPAARMRELVLAVRAIWAAWNEQTKLDFRGDFYQHTLMTPFFDPGANPYGTPRVFVAAVGERMTEVAGEVGDGLLTHGLSTEQYFREVTEPAIARGMAKSGRRRPDFEVTTPVPIITGEDEAAMAVADRRVRKQLAFYASTPAYRPVLDHHGWGDVQPELHDLSKQGRWDDMASLVTAEMTDAFAVRAAPDDVGPLVTARYGRLVDRITFYAPYHSSPGLWSRVLAGFDRGRRALDALEKDET